jgi:hypothetical protein
MTLPSERIKEIMASKTYFDGNQLRTDESMEAKFSALLDYLDETFTEEKENIN